MFENITIDNLLALIVGIIVPLTLAILVFKAFRSKRQVQKVGDNSIGIQAGSGSLNVTLTHSSVKDAKVGTILDDGVSIMVSTRPENNDDG